MVYYTLGYHSNFFRARVEHILGALKPSCHRVLMTCFYMVSSCSSMLWFIGEKSSFFSVQVQNHVSLIRERNSSLSLKQDHNPFHFYFYTHISTKRSCISDVIIRVKGCTYIDMMPYSVPTGEKVKDSCVGSCSCRPQAKGGSPTLTLFNYSL